MTAIPPEPRYERYRHGRSKRLQPLRRALEYGLARLVLVATSRMSVPGLQGLGRLIGWLGFRLAKKQRGICEYQLRMAYPMLQEAERTRLIRNCFAHMGMTVCEALGQRRIRAEAMRWIHTQGEQALLRAHGRGRGVMMITAHTGNWELLPTVMERLELKHVVVVRSLPNPKVNDLMRGLRGNPYLTLAERGDPASARKLLGCLKDGEVLVMVADNDIDVQGLWVDFYGIPAFTPRAPASLTLKTGAALVTAFDVRQPDGSHTFHFEELETTAAPPEKTGKDKAAAAKAEHDLTRLIVNATEKHIRRYPDQWSWNHRRWRRRPPEEKSAEAPATEASPES